MKDKQTYLLIMQLLEAMKTQNQELINVCAYQLTTKLYVKNNTYTFQETLEGFGYREIVDDRQISIEEYMRTRNDE